MNVQKLILVGHPSTGRQERVDLCKLVPGQPGRDPLKKIKLILYKLQKVGDMLVHTHV